MIEMNILPAPHHPWYSVGGNILNARDQVCTCKTDTFREGGRLQVKCIHLRALNFYLKEVGKK